MIIYKATNKVNNKSYIGQTIYTIENRKLNHITKSNGYSKLAIHRAIRKYGEENFEWEVIDDTAKNVDELNLLEQKYIKEYDTFGKGGYNMTEGGWNATHSTETKYKIARGVLLTREKTGRINQYTIAKDNGEVYADSKETRMKKSESHKGIKNHMYGKRGKLSPHFGKKYSSERCKNISKALKGRSFTNEWKQKLKLAWDIREMIKCPHCDIKSKNMANMKRWHFNNCKENLLNANSICK